MNVYNFCQSRAVDFGKYISELILENGEVIRFDVLPEEHVLLCDACANTQSGYIIREILSFKYSLFFEYSDEYWLDERKIEQDVSSIAAICLRLIGDNECTCILHTDSTHPLRSRHQLIFPNIIVTEDLHRQMYTYVSESRLNFRVPHRVVEAHLDFQVGFVSSFIYSHGCLYETRLCDEELRKGSLKNRSLLSKCCKINCDFDSAKYKAFKERITRYNLLEENFEKLDVNDAIELYDLNNRGLLDNFVKRGL